MHKPTHWTSQILIRENGSYCLRLCRGQSMHFNVSCKLNCDMLKIYGSENKSIRDGFHMGFTVYSIAWLTPINRLVIKTHLIWTITFIVWIITAECRIFFCIKHTPHYSYFHLLIRNLNKIRGSACFYCLPVCIANEKWPYSFASIPNGAPSLWCEIYVCIYKER